MRTRNYFKIYFFIENVHFSNPKLFCEINYNIILSLCAGFAPSFLS